MLRLFSLFSSLLIAVGAFAQGQPPAPPLPPETVVTLISQTVTITPADPTKAVLYVNAAGDTTGILGQLTKRVVIDSTMLANLPTTPIVIVPAPGDNNYIIPRYMVVSRSGTVESIETATDGQALLTFALGAETSGFISHQFDPTMPDAFAVFLRSAQILWGAFNAVGGKTFENVPTGFFAVRLRENTPIKLFPSILRQKPLSTDAETWADHVAKVSSDWELRLHLYYTIVELPD